MDLFPRQLHLAAVDRSHSPSQDREAEKVYMCEGRRAVPPGDGGEGALEPGQVLLCCFLAT